MHSEETVNKTSLDKLPSSEGIDSVTKQPILPSFPQRVVIKLHRSQFVYSITVCYTLHFLYTFPQIRQNLLIGGVCEKKFLQFDRNLWNIINLIRPLCIPHTIQYVTINIMYGDNKLISLTEKILRYVANCYVGTEQCYG